MTPTRIFESLLLLGFLTLHPCAAAQEDTPEVNTLIEQLRTSGRSDPQKQGRRDAARILSQLGPKASAAVPALIEALDDSDTQVWFHSVTALAHIGPEASPAIPALLADLEGGGSRSVNAKWYRSAFALGNMGPGAIPELRKALKDDDDGIRSGVALAFGWLGPEAREAIQDLITLLKDENETVRTHAAESIGKIGPTILPELKASLNSSDHRIQLGALRAIGTLGPESKALAPEVTNLTQASGTPDIQATALRTLSILGLEPSQILEATWAQSQHSDEAVRHEVGNNLLDLPSELTLPLLVERLNFKDLASRLWAADLLGRMGPTAVDATPILVKQVTLSQHPSQSQIFAQAIASIGPAAADTLFDHVRTLSTEDIGPEHWIVESLGSYGIPGLQKLSRKLRSDEINEQIAAIYAVSHLGTNGRNTVPRIEASLREGQATIQAASLFCLMAISPDPDRYQNDVRRLLNDEHKDARRIAATSISRLSNIDPALIERLGELLQDAEPDIRLASTQALTSIGEDAVDQADKIAALLVEDRVEIKIAAVNAIGAVGSATPLAATQIAFLADQAEGELRLAAMKSLSRIGSAKPSFAKVVRTGIQDTDEAIREAALKAFARVIEDSQESLAVNLEALEDDAVPVRLVAARNLGDLGEIAIPAIRPLMSLLSDRGNFTSYLNALKDIPADAGHLDAYQNGLESRSSGIRAFSCEALGRLREIALPVVPRLERLAKGDRSGYVKSRARSAVERITGEDRDWD